MRVGMFLKLATTPGAIAGVAAAAHVARVFLSAIAFGIQRDWSCVLVTTIVLAVLLRSALGPIV